MPTFGGIFTGPAILAILAAMSCVSAGCSAPKHCRREGKDVEVEVDVEVEDKVCLCCCPAEQSDGGREWKEARGSWLVHLSEVEDSCLCICVCLCH